MAHRKTSKRSKTRSMLRLADLEQSKNAVLHSLGAASSQESYGHAIDEFIGWYCSEPRLAFNRTVVLRYRFFLEQKNLAPSTINVRLAAVRRLAYEASDTGLLSPDLAAGIRRVKGAKRLGAQIGNWLTADQTRTLLGEPRSGSLCPSLPGLRGKLPFLVQLVHWAVRHSPTSPARTRPPFGLWPSRTGLVHQTKACRRSPGSRDVVSQRAAGSQTTQDLTNPLAIIVVVVLPSSLTGTESAS